uniref:Uncharacterized protein n=1 Tax=Rhizophora mucronata TaxID=61149 RepID=A0A2P2NHY1_RHIMU
MVTRHTGFGVHWVISLFGILLVEYQYWLEEREAKTSRSLCVSVLLTGKRHRTLERNFSTRSSIWC